MSQQSAKRYGIDVKGDLEQEIRLRRIESELERKVYTNLEDDTSISRTSTVPKVTGLRVVGTIPGAVTVAWNSVLIPNLRRYEVRLAENLSFSQNLQTINTATTLYHISTVSASGGGGNTTIYVKVRAVNVSGASGPWSITLNTTTGQAVTGDFEEDSVTTDKVVETDISSFNTEDLSNYLATVEGLKGSISGLILSRPSDTTIKVTEGSTTRFRQFLTSDITKSITSTWTAGNNNGGLATGTVANDTWYYVFLIRNSVDEVVDVGFDTNITAVNLLAISGYDQYRLLGGVKTNVSATSLIDFIQDHELFMWYAPKSLPTYTTISRSPRTLLTLNEVPPGANVEAIVQTAAIFTSTEGPGVLYLTDPQMTDSTPDAGNMALPAAIVAGNALGQVGGWRVGTSSSFGQAEVLVMTNTSQQIGVSGSDHDDQSPTDYILRVHGYKWFDLRRPVLLDSN